ncbi:flavin reductase [Burkholderia aenigmatica]|uniref:flavin reductase n=1 Tax=Burkholderia cepacia complex TaxID=87882 RepID=UPI000F075C0B|nr:MULTISPECIES: flavin reductase [Burkholderia cepacia complex]AYQ40891.1 flavin reductase [Burkholderia lata]VWC61852.1 flavin reductase [Burkholderia aenigmatica]
MVMPTQFRDAMSRLGAAVNVVTTNGLAGLGGFTASAVCSVTDSPPTLLVCMNQSSHQYDRFEANGVLCVNVLAAGQEHVSRLFSGQTRASIEDRFAQTKYAYLETGSPVLPDSLVCFDCKIDRIEKVGTHGILFCQVVGIGNGSQAGGLLYFDRAYHRLTSVRPV